MKKLLAIALLAFTASAAFADTKTFPAKNPVASITIPDKWKVDVDEEALDISSPDEEVYLSLEVHDAANVGQGVKDAHDYLEKNKVKLDKSTEQKTKNDANGRPSETTQWKGTDKNGDCNVTITTIKISEKKVIVALYWASPAGEEKHGLELLTMFASLKPAGK